MLSSTLFCYQAFSRKTRWLFVVKYYTRNIPVHKKRARGIIYLRNGTKIKMFKSSGEKKSVSVIYEVALQILMMMRCDDELLLLLLKIERKRTKRGHNLVLSHSRRRSALHIPKRGICSGAKRKHLDTPCRK